MKKYFHFTPVNLLQINFIWLVTFKTTEQRNWDNTLEYIGKANLPYIPLNLFTDFICPGYKLERVYDWFIYKETRTKCILMYISLVLNIKLFSTDFRVAAFFFHVRTTNTCYVFWKINYFVFSFFPFKVHTLISNGVAE